MKKGFIQKNYNLILIMLAISVILLNIKSILTDYNYDSGYAVAQAYRILRGDAMFSQMWEPHQTSAFLCAGLMKLYHLITGTYDGVVIYLQTMGVIIKGFFTWMIYQTLKRKIPKSVLSIMCIFFFSVSPKGLPMPEFSNMQLWFSIGAFCFLISYFSDQNKKWKLILAGIFLCLEILSYPSCLIVFPGILLLIYFYSSNRVKDGIILTLTCFLLGSIYCGYFLSVLGYNGFLQGIINTVFGDNSHNISLSEKLFRYGKELVNILLYLVSVGTITGIVAWLVKKGDYIKLSLKRYWVSFFFLALLIRDIVVSIGVHMEYDERLPIYIPFIIVALYTINACNGEERRIVVSGLTISICGFVATLLLTNLTIAATLNYLVLGIMVSFLPIMKKIEKTDTDKGRTAQYGIIFLFLTVTLFRNAYIMKCMSTEKTNIFNIRGIVTEGPVKGIASEHMGPYILNNTYNEWKKHIKSGDRVLIIGELYDPIYYLYEDVEISTPSTICTPTYNEFLLEYWKNNPEKYPNVVIVDCWFGEERVEQDSWIMDWVKNEFEWTSVTDGMYWRYYRAE